MVNIIKIMGFRISSDFDTLVPYILAPSITYHFVYAKGKSLEILVVDRVESFLLYAWRDCIPVNVCKECLNCIQEKKKKDLFI
jgi:hypothetical protein